MKFLKIFFIAFLVTLVIIIAIYSTFPLLVKNQIPKYLNNNFLVQNTAIQSTYYSSFNTLEINNLTFRVNQPGIHIWVNLPKIIFTLKKTTLNKNSYFLKILHPVVLNKVDVNKFKKIKSKKNINTKSISKSITNITKNKFLQSLLENTIIKDGIYLFKNIQIKKFIIKNLKGKINYENNVFSFLLSEGDAFQGKMRGSIKIKIKGHNFFHRTKLYFSEINLSKLEELAQPKNYSFTGIYSGSLWLEGKNLSIQSVKGNLTSTEKGGKISIAPAKLKNFLNTSKDKNIELAVKQLRDFQYNEGSIKLRTENGKLIAHTIFKGPAGEKEIKFVFHNYLNQIESILVK